MKDWLIIGMLVIAVTFFTYQRLDGDEARQDTLQTRITTVEDRLSQLTDHVIDISPKAKKGRLSHMVGPTSLGGRPLAR